MNRFVKVLAAGLVALSACAANAGLINFASMADNPPGEYGINPLLVSTGGIDITITGHTSTSGAYAYLDAGNAGLGVCKRLDSASQCTPGNDDNVTTDEFLRFVFSEDAIISTLWFNNNHDGGAVNKHVLINGASTTFSDGMAGGANGVNVNYFVAAGSYFEIAYSDVTFYVSGMNVSSVPEPGTIFLFGLGLLAVVGARRKLAR